MNKCLDSAGSPAGSSGRAEPFVLAPDTRPEAPSASDLRTPVTLLTGFLGSGKTTLLNAWLRDPALADAAVIVNEFGEIGIDHTLIASSSENTIELSTGCLCCTVKGDLVETLRDLAERRSQGKIAPFNRVVIETTGLADPAPVVQALMTFPVAGAYRLGRILTAVDSVQGANTIERHPEASKQVAVADGIILTKKDLHPQALPHLLEVVGRINPAATIHYATLGEVPPASLLDFIDPYDPATKPADVVEWLRAESLAEAAHHGAHGHGGHRHHHDVNRHGKDILTFCLTYDEPLHWEHVAAWLDALVLAHGEDLLRVKGIVNIAGRERPIIVQAVQNLFSPPAELSDWPNGDRRSRLVFITRGLDRAFITEVLAVIRSRSAHLGAPSFQPTA